MNELHPSEIRGIGGRMEPRMQRSASAQARPRRRKTAWVSRQGLVAAALLLGAGLIVVNAVALQTERHPEPLFQPIAKVPAALPVPPQRQEVAKAAFEPKPLAATRAATLQGTQPPTPPQAPPANAPLRGSIHPEASEAMLLELQRELAKRGYYKGEADGKAGPRLTQAIRDFQFAQRQPVDGKPSEAVLRDVLATKTTMKDELLDLVRQAGTDAGAQRTVRDIQRALNKAGYGPLKEDGQWGPTTRQALTRFEQDNRLPAKGEPKGQNIRTLASITGVQIAQ